MIDIHTHLLPGIDDGSMSVDQTMQIIDEAEKAGFTDIITTSHYIENVYDFSKTKRQEMIDALQNIINSKNINLYNGAEIYITTNMLELLENSTIPTLADSRYVLFELPMSKDEFKKENIRKKTIDLIKVLRENNYIPIIAHPERYEAVKDDPELAIEWVYRGALLQSNYGSLSEKYGFKAKRTVAKLLKANAIHFLGSDNHRENTIYADMKAYQKNIVKLIGKERFNELTETNPRAVLNNETIRIRKPKEI